MWCIFSAPAVRYPSPLPAHVLKYWQTCWVWNRDHHIPLSSVRRSKEIMIWHHKRSCHDFMYIFRPRLSLTFHLYLHMSWNTDKLVDSGLAIIIPISSMRRSKEIMIWHHKRWMTSCTFSAPAFLYLSPLLAHVLKYIDTHVDSGLLVIIIVHCHQCSN